MSLINQVLNDLEKRGASTNIGEATVRVVPLQQSHGSFWVIVAVISIVALAAIAWLKWGDDIQLKTPQIELAAAPAPLAIQPASQPVVAASAETQPEQIVPVPPLVSKLNAATKVTTLAAKPAPEPLPVITAVSPEPAISLGLPQPVTITGSNYASDATVILRTPKGKVSTKQRIVMQSATQIVISANFRNNAGQWSVEVVNAGDQSTSNQSHSQHSSGQYTFQVQAAPVVVAEQAKNVAQLPAPRDAGSVAKPAPVEKPPVALPKGGISKQLTQITPQQQAENEFRKAYALMQKGQVNAAISGYEAALQLDAGHIVARQTLVRLLLENKRIADAERVLLEGLQFDPRQHSLAILLARIQVGRNEIPQALETMQKSLPYAEKQPDYQAFVAALMQRQNRHQEAITHFKAALQLNPQSGVWLMGLGISLRAEQQNAEARDAFTRALEVRNLSTELQAFVTQQLKEL